jgi:hypothetical protein
MIKDCHDEHAAYAAGEGDHFPCPGPCQKWYREDTFVEYNNEWFCADCAEHYRMEDAEIDRLKCVSLRRAS